jgi:hypothetical protein
MIFIVIKASPNRGLISSIHMIIHQIYYSFENNKFSSMNWNLFIESLPFVTYKDFINFRGSALFVIYFYLSLSSTTLWHVKYSISQFFRKTTNFTCKFIDTLKFHVHDRFSFCDIKFHFYLFSDFWKRTHHNNNTEVVKKLFSKIF